MKEYMNSTRLLTKLRMLRTGKKSKTFILVEGITDLRLYGKLVDRSQCEMIVGECKQNVVECIKKCSQEHIEGVIGIVDADFSRLEEKPSEKQETLFMTDFHDLECMLLKSAAYQNILIEYANERKCAKLERKIGMNVLQRVLENTSMIGYLRWYSLKLNLGLKFTGLDLEDFIKDDFQFEWQSFIEAVLFHSKKQHSMRAEGIMTGVQNLRKSGQDPWQVCCGHDLIEILTVGLKRYFGEYNAKELEAGELEGSFRLAYNRSYFVQTQLYRSLKIWEQTNGKYRIF